MSEIEYYVVELMAEQFYEQQGGENTFTLPVPIVDGPFSNEEDAHAAATGGAYGQSFDGYAVVSVPKGEVPEGWYEA